jgi:hypothetical protein
VGVLNMLLIALPATLAAVPYKELLAVFCVLIAFWPS